MKKNTKKKLKLPINAYLSYLLVAALLLSGVTFSKYVTSTNAGDSARAATFGDLSLVEAEDPKSFIIAPGVNIKKNPVVSFGTNKTSESAAYVFVYVTANGWTFHQAQDQDPNNTYTLSKTVDETNTTTPLLTWTVDEKWTCMQADPYNTCQIYFCYLKPGEKLDKVSVIKDGTIAVSKELYNSDYEKLESDLKSITFTAYAVQQEGSTNEWYAWEKIQNAVSGNN